MDTDSQHIEHRMVEMNKRLDNISGKVDKMYEALVGNEFGKDISIVSRLATVEEELRNLRDFKNRVVWTVIICSSAAGVVGFAIELFYNYIKNK